MYKNWLLLCLVALLVTFAFAGNGNGNHDDDDDHDDEGPGARKWNKLDANGGGPLPRSVVAAVAFDDQIYTFGGFKENIDPTNSAPNVWYNDVWRFNTNSRRWNQRPVLPDSASGTTPSPRGFVVSGRHGDEMIVGFGIKYSADFSDITTYNDLWGYNINTNRWRRIRANGAAGGPSARADCASAIYNGKLYIFGGVTAAFQPLDETWVYDFSTRLWTQLTFAPGASPSARYGTTFALDKKNGRMILYGGETLVGYEFLFAGPDAHWAFDFATAKWTLLQSRVAIPNRNNGNGAVYVNNKFFLFGGDIGGGDSCPNAVFTQNNVRESWIWDARINAWLQLCPQDAPPNLKRATSVAIDNDVYLFGGWAFDTTTCGPYIYSNDVYKYTIKGCYGGVPCASL